MANQLSREELEDAIGKMQKGKTKTAQKVKAVIYDDNFLNVLPKLVKIVWREGTVPKDQADAVLVLIPKGVVTIEGHCSAGVGKIVANFKIAPGELQQLAEDELLESQ